MRSRWANATVRSPRHSSTMTSSAPCRAKSTAGSSRSAENPAPVPIRNTCDCLVMWQLALPDLERQQRVGLVVAFQRVARLTQQIRDIDRGQRIGAFED